MSLFHFPPWTNKIKYLLGAGLAGGAFYAFLIVNFGFSPKTTDVGYQPEQPVPFSHALHSGQLAIDCRYCHTTVENAKHSAVPATETCMNCHSSCILRVRSLPRFARAGKAVIQSSGYVSTTCRITSISTTQRTFNAVSAAFHATDESTTWRSFSNMRR